MQKDAGVDPATVAWTLEQLRIAPTAHLPGSADPHELEEFRLALIPRLRAIAHSTTPR
jgi:hypothetical protein